MLKTQGLSYILRQTKDLCPLRYFLSLASKLHDPSLALPFPSANIG